MSPQPPAPDIDERAKDLSRNADLRGAAEALKSQRTSILKGWLSVASRQPFHSEHPERAVADHIPELFDALTGLLSRDKPGQDIEAPMDDAHVAAAARAHAQMRFEQGLDPVAIATEFRLLRQEISRALRVQLDEQAQVDDVISSLAVVNDAIDGATMLALSTLIGRVETVREEFLATTLHDVRQPIALIEVSVALATRWVKREPLDVPRLSETLEGALLATQEMSNLIDTLADASRVALGSLDLTREPTSVRAIVTAALGAVGHASRARVHVIESMALDGVVYWDRESMRRVMINLLTNALKYSPAGSSVAVSVVEDGGWVEITVRDHGIGLLPAERALLFQRYSRIPEARRRGLPGLGLGLFASKGLVESHGGRIELASDGRDRGTTATVVMPVGQSGT